MNDPEGIVLSGLLKSQDARTTYLQGISPSDFAVKSHKQIFQAVLNMSQNGGFTKEGIQAAFSGDVTMQMMVTFLYGNDVPPLTREVFDHFKRAGRQNRLTAVQQYLSREIAKGTPAENITDQVRQMLGEVESADAHIEVSDPQRSVESTQWMLDKWAKGEDPVTSGLPELDNELFLSQFIGYWVVAGSRSSGKSCFMINVAKSNAMRGIPVTLCSLEMSKELLYIRMAMSHPLARGVRLTSETIKNQKKMDELKYAVDTLKELPIYVVEGCSNIFRLDKISRRNAIDKGCKLTMFDYIQLGRTNPTDPDVVRVSAVSRTLFGLTQPDLPSGYHGQAVIALSQYNGDGQRANAQARREEESNTRSGSARRAGNDDLAWSAQIANDADGILHLYSSGGRYDRRVEIFCGKQRNHEADWCVHTDFITSEQRFETAGSRSLR